MISEHDIVVLLHDIEEYGLKQGDIGTVVHDYKNGEAYEVEFVTGKGRTIAILTLMINDVRLMGEREILHARELVPT